MGASVRHLLSRHTTLDPYLRTLLSGVRICTMIGDADSIFLDTNILVYANTVGSPLRDLAQQALKELNDTGSVLYISRQVMREYLAALTRPQGPIALVPVALLIPDIRQFEAEFRVVEDGPQVTEKLLDLLSSTEVGG